ncbi:MAG: hypothetical protein ACK5IM_11600 [Demequina sp.]|uniref:hypothetical protein n=1 Tax=Demequina sp. TaxID=2050685 RepID=UPI003A844801
MITGPMRWAAGVVLALGAGFGAWLAGPVWAPLGTFDDGTGPAWLPWLVVIGGCVVAVTAAALVAGWAGRSMATGTPVDELREAQREGAR